MPTVDNAVHIHSAILIASQFDEAAVVHCYVQLHRYGLQPGLVGLPAKVIQGIRNLAICSNVTLNQFLSIKKKTSLQLLVIPGSLQCTKRLVSDPRVYHLISDTLDCGGHIAVLSPKSRSVMVKIGLLTLASAKQILIQNNQETAVFVKQLIEYISTSAKRIEP